MVILRISFDLCDVMYLKPSDQCTVSTPLNPWETNFKSVHHLQSSRITITSTLRETEIEEKPPSRLRVWQALSLLGSMTESTLKVPPCPRLLLYFVCIYHPFRSWPHVQPVGNSTCHWSEKFPPPAHGQLQWLPSLFFLPMWPYLINQRFKICFNLSSKCLTEPFIQNFFILGPIPYI